MLNRRQFLQSVGVTVVGATAVVAIPGSAYSHDTVFVLDVSGSMPVDRIHKIMLEASKHNGLLITFSTEVLDVIDMQELTADTKLSISGGSDISCVSDYFVKHGIYPRNTVVFTDGYLFGLWGELPSNTTFVIVNDAFITNAIYYDNYNIVAPYGTTKHIKEI